MQECNVGILQAIQISKSSEGTLQLTAVLEMQAAMPESAGLCAQVTTGQIF